MGSQSNRGPRRPSGSGTLSPARERALRAVSELGGRDITLNEVAARLGGHPNGSRQHLDALVRDGYLQATEVLGRGPGRRPRGHTVTPLGQRELTVQAAESTELVEVFASYLIAEGHGSEEARAIGEAWAARQPEPATAEHETAVDAVIEVLDILGFDPERTNTPDGEALVLHTCPLLDAAHRNPEFICQVHQGLIDGILKRVGAREGLELLPFSDAAGCRIRPTG